MKKTFSPLLSFLIGLAGFTTVCAENSYWTYNDIITNLLPNYKNNFPIEVTAVGASISKKGIREGIHYSKESGLYFTDAYLNDTELNREYKIAFYTFTGNHSETSADNSTGFYMLGNNGWVFCNKKSDCEDGKDLSYHSIQDLHFNDKGGSYNYTLQNYLAEQLNEGFETSNNIHVALSKVGLKNKSDGTEINVIASSHDDLEFKKENVLRALFFMDFFKPAEAKLYFSNINGTSHTAGENIESAAVGIDGQLQATYTSNGGYDGLTDRTVKYFITRQDYNPDGSLTESNSTIPEQNITPNANGVAEAKIFNGTYKWNDGATKYTKYFTVDAKTTQIFSKTIAKLTTDTTTSSNQIKIWVKHKLTIETPYNSTSKFSCTSTSCGTFYIHSSTEPDNIATTGNFESKQEIQGTLGAKLIIVANQGKGFEFDSWQNMNGDTISTSGSLDLSFISDTTVRPVFKEKPLSFYLTLEGEQTDYYKHYNGEKYVPLDNNASEAGIIYNDGHRVRIHALVTSVGTTRYRVRTSKHGTGNWKTLLDYDFTGNLSTTLKCENGNKNCENNAFVDYDELIGGINPNGSFSKADKYDAGSLDPANASDDIEVCVNNYYNSTGLTPKSIACKTVTINWYHVTKFTAPVEGYSTPRVISIDTVSSETVINIPDPSSKYNCETTETRKCDYQWDDQNNSGSYLSSDTKQLTVNRPIHYNLHKLTQYRVRFLDWDNEPIRHMDKTADNAVQWILSGEKIITKPADADHNSNSSYKFTGWSGDLESAVTDARDIKATYKNYVNFIAYGFTYNSEFFESGADAASLAAHVPEANAGDSFIGWYVDGDESQTIVTDFTINEATTFIAKFITDSKITATSEGLIGYGEASDVKFSTGNECVSLKYNGATTGGDAQAVKTFQNGVEYTADIIAHVNTAGKCAEDELVKEIVEARKYDDKVKVFIVIDGNKINTNINNEKLVATEAGEDGIIGTVMKYSFTPTARYLVQFMSTKGSEAKVISSNYYYSGDAIIMPTAEELKNVVIPKETVQNTYTFNNKWSPTMVENVSEDMTFYPEIDQNLREYSVTFIIGNIPITEPVQYGTSANKPIVVTKDGESFIGWYVEGDKSQTIVKDFTIKGAATFVAKIITDPVINATSEGLVGYGLAKDVKFSTGNECVTLKYKDAISSGSTSPVAQFQNDVEYTADVIAHVNTTFKCANDELVKEIVEARKYDDKVKIFFAIDEKRIETNVNIKELVTTEIGEDGIIGTVVKYSFTPTARYLVKFMSDEGSEAQVISSNYYYSGDAIIMPTAEELKNVVIPEETEQYQYAFDNEWTPTMVESVSEDMTFYPAFQQTFKQYDVIFMVDGKVVGKQRVQYGISAVEPELPTKEGYLFAGWLKNDATEVVYGKKGTDLTVTGPTTFTAKFNEFPTLKFTATGMIAGNDEITVKPPSKCFIIDENAALYEGSKMLKLNNLKMEAGKNYTWIAKITFNSDDKNCYSEGSKMDLAYYVAYEEAEKAGVWNIPDGIVAYVNDQVLDNVFEEGEINIAFEFTAAAQLYTITFLQSDGKTKISSKPVEKGKPIVAPAKDKITVPKPENGFNYVFKGWNPTLKDGDVVTGDASYTAQFEKVATSSSSSANKPASSSSNKTEAIVAGFEVPKFQATVSGLSLTVFGATVGSKLAIFDLQGSVITTGHVDAANFSVTLPHSGIYAVRIGNQIQKVQAR